MLSNIAETLGFACVPLGVYELAGKGWAVLAAAPVLMFLGLALEGLHPAKLMLAAAGDIRTAFALRREARRLRKAYVERQPIDEG